MSAGVDAVFAMFLRLERLTVALAAAEAQRDALIRAALQLCGQEDGRWIVYADEHGDAVRDYLIPALAATEAKP